MDIKDFILIGGGLLIAVVVAHGFWIAWRARRDPLRIDLVTDLPAEDGEDELKRLRAELPNGGARVIGQDVAPSQGALNLDREEMARHDEASAPPDPSGGETAGRAVGGRSKTEPRLAPSAPTAAAPEGPARRQPSSAGGAPSRDKVKDVILPERPVRADEPREARRWSARKPAAESRPAPAARDPRGERGAKNRRGEAVRRGDDRGRGEDRRQGAGAGRSGGVQAPSDSRKSEQAVEELIMLNVLAPKGSPFVGDGLVEALRARGLRYGDMNIFHRVDPMTRATLYSVANVVEPGTFDLADLESFRSPGVCFFMQLPGPEAPMDVFEDMLKVARDVAVRVDGTLLDEQRSVMTGQTVEHYRQRISEFCRRRMSMRA